MRGLTTPALVAPLLALVVIAWNVVLSGWIAARREAPRPFTSLTAVCGMLIAPAIVVAIASGTEAGSRTIVGITWIVPAIALAFVAQVLLALGLRIVSPVIAVPILVYDLAVAATAVGDYLVATQGEAPVALQAMVAARDAVIGLAAGRVSLVSPLALLVPMIVPAYQARWRLSGVARALMVLGATIVATLLITEWPRGYGAITSYNRAETVPQARPAGDFLVGMRLFPVLNGPPPARAALADIAMADSIGPDVILVLIDEAGVRGTALDSLARLLEPMRADSVVIAAALVNERVVGQPASVARALVIERILQRIRPDVFFPAFASPMPGTLPVQQPGLAWWRAAIAEGAKTVERVRPRTRVGWAASRLDATDSAMYVYASSPGSDVDIIGFVSFPSFSGLPGVDARLRAIDRWRNAALSDSAVSRPHWVTIAGGLPHAHGEVSQSASVLHAAAWATRRPWVNALIVGEPGDYTGRTGMRAADGRERPVVRTTARLARVMRDARASR